MNAMVRIDPQTTEFDEAAIEAALQKIPLDARAKYRVFGYHGQVFHETRDMYQERIARTKARDRAQGIAVEADEGNTMTEPQWTMTKEDRESARAAIGEVTLLLHDACRVFELIEQGIVGGFLDGDTGSIAALARMSSRAIEGARRHEMDTLEMHEVRLM
ncbi:hypothetical protein [Roseinatronobacter sp.]|uniref:hypothetical protein n=1 Tax=Roseinatronobacter sp. TaxID=1945755 RepID=UPI0025E2F6EB|nr:hypothetical protein [Roseibaca sp.]